MKIMVGIPAYDRRVSVETAAALLMEQAAARLIGAELLVCFAPGSSLIAHARNHIAKAFEESGAGRLVFVDGDVAWEAGALLRIAGAPVDFAGGAYRYKAAEEAYPVGWLPGAGDLRADPGTGLLEVASLPGGFMSLSRAVFERLRQAHPERSYRFGGERFQAYFHCPPGAGEDGAFCADWRAAGGRVWLDPELRLIHVGGRGAFTGRIGDFLRARAAA
jgi:hypothetical protein